MKNKFKICILILLLINISNFSCAQNKNITDKGRDRASDLSSMSGNLKKQVIPYILDITEKGRHPASIGSIHVINGFGRNNQLILKQKLTAQKIIGYQGNPIEATKLQIRYYAPYPSPDNKKIAYLKQIKDYSGANSLESFRKTPIKYQLSTYSLEEKKEKNLYKVKVPPKSRIGIGLRNVVWKNNQRLIFSEKQKGEDYKIHGLDLTTGNFEEVTKIPGTKNLHMSEHGYHREIQMNPSRDVVYIYVAGVWKFNLKNKNLEKVWDGRTWERDSLGEVSLFEQHTSGVKRKFDNWRKAGIPKEAVVSLFGSTEFPVVNPIHSSDYQYYFYEGSRDGFFASTWIKGYDRMQNRQFHVTTLGWMLYGE